MLCYWILRRPDGTPAGLVRAENDRVLLHLTVPAAADFTLFSAASAVPVTPGSEVRLSGAEAVLGTKDGRIVCFAAAPDAKPMAHYRERLPQICTKNAASAERSDAPTINPPVISQNSTIKEENLDDQAEGTDYVHRNSTIKADSISDSARETQAFSALLQRADAFYSAFESNVSTPDVDNLVQKVDNQEGNGIDLFAQEYPGARWRYVDGADVLPHYEGVWRQPGGQTMHILAVRGRAAPRPPRALFGFTRFLRDRDGTGYWLRLTPLP